MKFSFLAALVSVGLVKSREERRKEKQKVRRNTDVVKETIRWDNSMMPRIRYPR